MQSNVTRTFWQCDMCKHEILEDRFTRVVLRELTWDLCVHCADKLLPSLQFLNITVGIDVLYNVLEGEQ